MGSNCGKSNSTKNCCSHINYCILWAMSTLIQQWSEKPLIHFYSSKTLSYRQIYRSVKFVSDAGQFANAKSLILTWICFLRKMLHTGALTTDHNWIDDRWSAACAYVVCDWCSATMVFLSLGSLCLPPKYCIKLPCMSLGVDLYQILPLDNNGRPWLALQRCTSLMWSWVARFWWYSHGPRFYSGLQRPKCPAIGFFTLEGPLWCNVVKVPA